MSISGKPLCGYNGASRTVVIVAWGILEILGQPGQSEGRTTNSQASLGAPDLTLGEGVTQLRCCLTRSPG